MNAASDEIQLRPLTPDDAAAVSELAIRSKSVWGYSAEKMAVFCKELTISREELSNRIATGAVIAGEMVGYYTLKEGSDEAELEQIFVDPAWLKKGVGSKLLQHALDECLQRGYRRVIVLSDPNAAGFYTKAGADLIENIRSSIPGRTIPKFQFDLISPEYLAATEIIDHTAPNVRALAVAIRAEHMDVSVVARRCFEWVRDHVEHSLDFQRTELTCRASDVLAKRTGYCYAKSHLLAALLRANGIPAGFCYQRLTVEGDQPPYCLHGLNAVYLNGHGWYRVDARGNKPGVNAQFTPPLEQLAFSTSSLGEFDFPEVWAQPLPPIVEALQRHSDVKSLAECLPDLTIDQMKQLREQTAIPPTLLDRKTTT